MWKHYSLLLAAVLCRDFASAFVVPFSSRGGGSFLAAVRQPRRNLKKRKGRERRSPANPFPDQNKDTSDVWETKPLIASQRKEAGEDFWIDPEDLKKEKLRQQAINNRKSMEGEIPKDKLMTEVVAPYKQNWIGTISVLIIVLAAIVTNFPELLENPSIGFPDLDSGDPIPLQSTLKAGITAASESVKE